EEATSLLKSNAIHLAIVDIMMPLKNGLELCREIRAHYDIPVLLLTAKGELKDKELGFQSGTDDYMVKPFEPKELLFRVTALLRRYKVMSSHYIQLGNCLINRQSYVVKCDDTVIELPLKEFQLLIQLAEHPGRIYTREQLITLIWGADYYGDSRTVDVHIKRLRERFLPFTQDFKITTVRG